MKMYPIVTKQGTQGNLFLGVFDSGMSKSEKERGTKLAESHLGNWKQAATDYVLNLPKGSEFTADDLVAEVGLPTYEDGSPNNNGLGGFISGLATKGLIYRTGFQNSGRVTNHARVQRIWRVR